MFKQLMTGFFLVLVVASVALGQKKEESFRIKYYEKYEMKSNQFTNQLNDKGIKSASQYYKLFLSAKGKRVKAEKYEEGKMSLYYFFDEADGLSVYFSYLYDEDNKVIRIERMNKDSKMVLYQTLHYGKEKKRLKKLVEHFPGGREIGVRKYIYNSHDKPIKAQIYIGGALLYEKEFRYNAYGDLIYGGRVLAPGNIDLNNPDHLIWIYSEVISNPSDAAKILKKYGIDTSSEIETFYRKIADLAELPGFQEKLQAMLDLREENSAFALSNVYSALEVEPTVEPLDSHKRVLSFDRKNFISLLDDVTMSAEIVIKEFNALEIDKTLDYHKKMSVLARKMKMFQKVMNITKFDENNRAILDYYAGNYPNALRGFLSATQEAGELYKRKMQLDFESAGLIKSYNSRINNFVSIHNQLVHTVNNK